MSAKVRQENFNTHTVHGYTISIHSFLIYRTGQFHSSWMGSGFAGDICSGSCCSCHCCDIFDRHPRAEDTSTAEKE